MIFFWSSLVILIVAQLAYVIAFWYRFGDRWDLCGSLCLFCCCLPLSPILSFSFYFLTDLDPNSWLYQKINNDYNCGCFDLGYYNSNNSNNNNKKKTKLQQWFEDKVFKHLGFIMEALFEAFPQSILQLIAIVYYSDTSNYISIISILLSMISVSSKSFVLSVAASYNWKSAVFTWLSCITDFFGIFFTVSMVFYVPNYDGNDDFKQVFVNIRYIWMLKIICCILPFAVVGSIGVNIYWILRLLGGEWNLRSKERNWRFNCFDLTVDILYCIVIGFFINLAWIVGLCLTVMSMEIACFILIAVTMYRVGLKHRLRESDASEQTFFLDLISWIKQYKDIYDYDGDNNKIIHAKHDRIIRVCAINYILQDTLGFSDEMKTKQYLISNQHNNYADVHFTDLRVQTNDQQRSEFVGKFVHGFYAKMYYGSKGVKDLWKPGDIESKCNIDCIYYILFYLTFIAGPLYIVSRLLNVLFPLLIVLYLLIGYDTLYWYPYIDTFQLFMFAVYICFILILFMVTVLSGLMTEQFYGWHIFPWNGTLHFDHVSKRYIKPQLIMGYYDNIVNIPIIKRILKKRFGDDIGNVIIGYSIGHVKQLQVPNNDWKDVLESELMSNDSIDKSALSLEEHVWDQL